MIAIHNVLSLLFLSASYVFASSSHPLRWGLHICHNVRGGDQTVAAPASDKAPQLSLDEKVRNAMQRLGLTVPSMIEAEDLADEPGQECESGACPLPSAGGEIGTELSLEPATEENPIDMATRIATDMGVNMDLAMAALGATGEISPGKDRKLDEKAARALIQNELDVIAGVPTDSEDVQQLVSEGHDSFLARRALAFAEGNMADARAILVADQMDAEEESSAEMQRRQDSMEVIVDPTLIAKSRDDTGAAPSLKTVSVAADFDPTSATLPINPQAQAGISPPKPAQKSEVVFEATTSQIQELVLESPVPVLLDCYAPWCGPCKALTPILEEIAVKGGGAFRLVKVNTDNERPVSSALEVTALPTIYAVRNGKILNSFQGMPSGEEMMKNFLMVLLMPGATFNPPVSESDKSKFDELSSKLAKVAGAASFSFSARERLQTRMGVHLEALVQAHGGNMADAEDSAKVVRSLISAVIREPYSSKFRRINLQNKKVAAMVAAYPPCLAILKSVGFGMEASGTAMVA